MHTHGAFRMHTSPTGIGALDAACRAVGGQSQLAAALGIKSPSISGWRRSGKVPADRCIAIETATGGQVTRYQLRPDVFGDAPPSDLQEVG